MSLSLTTLGPIIQEKYEPAYTKAHWENDRLFPLLNFPQKLPESPGGRYANWIVKYSGPTAAVYSEGDSAPSTSSSSYMRAYVSPVYVWAFIEVTGHARDALKGGVFDAIAEETEAAATSLVDLFTTSFLGSTYGLENAVDVSAGVNYGGITRASYTWWQSVETDLSSANISYTAVRDMIETMRAQEHGSKISKNNGLILVPENQLSNFYDIAGSRGINQLPANDAAAGIYEQTFGGIPIASIPDMTSTVALYLDRSPGNFDAQEHRPFEVVFYANSADNTVYKATAGIAVRVRNPVKHGKHTGIAA